MKKYIYLFKSSDFVNCLRFCYKRLLYILKYRKIFVTLTEPYASHLPVLLKLVKTNNLTGVIEVGAGNYSTKFLGLILGSMKSKLISIEDDLIWFNKLKEDYSNGFNVELIYSPDPNDELEKKTYNLNFDLIFIDNGKVPRDRIKIIESAFKKDIRFIVIHDVEEPIYNRFIKSILGGDRVFAEIDTFYPHTGIVFRNKDQDVISKLTKFIRINKSTSLLDFERWIDLIDSFDQK